MNPAKLQSFMDLDFKLKEEQLVYTDGQCESPDIKFKPLNLES